MLEALQTFGQPLAWLRTQLKAFVKVKLPTGLYRLQVHEAQEKHFPSTILEDILLCVVIKKLNNNPQPLDTTKTAFAVGASASREFR